MNRTIILLILVLTFTQIIQSVNSIEKYPYQDIKNPKNDHKNPLGEPGLKLTYRHCGDKIQH